MSPFVEYLMDLPRLHNIPEEMLLFTREIAEPVAKTMICTSKKANLQAVLRTVAVIEMGLPRVKRAALDALKEKTNGLLTE